MSTDNSSSSAATSTPAGTPRRDWFGVGLVVLVAGCAIALAGAEYSRFRTLHRYLWTCSTHDRNAHYLAGLRVAQAIRDLDPFHFVRELEKARVWPPLHPFLEGTILSVAGFDYQLAVLPSLIGWVCTAVFAFLICRRALVRGGTVAGLVSASLVLASPTFHSYATDIMLESMGAGLTLAVIYCYLRAAQDDSRSAYRMLAVTLTALFLQKYNYWTLAAFALIAAELTNRMSVYLGWLRAQSNGADWGALVRSELQQPLNYVLAPLVILIVAIRLRGDRPVEMAGRSLNVYPPEVLVTVAYAIFFLRLARWYWRGGRSWLAQQDPRAQQVALWHVAPLAVYFVLPKHLSAFLWYMSTNNGPELVQRSWLERTSFYIHHAAVNYHIGVTVAVLAFILAATAPLTWRNWKRGASVVLFLTLIAALLTFSHPNRQGRFLHSWIAAVWVAAGYGVAGIEAGLAGLGLRRLGVLTASVGAAAVLFLTWPGLVPGRRSDEAGPTPDRPCVLDITDAYAPELFQAKKAVVLSALAIKPLVQWSCLQHDGNLRRLDEKWYGFAENGADNRQGFLRWLETTPCDLLVYCDRLPNLPPIWESLPEDALHAELRDLVHSQHHFRLVKEQTLPQVGCRVEIWQRDNSTALRGGD